MKRRLRFALRVLAVGVLVCAGLVGGLLAKLRPERADPATVRGRAPARIVRTVTPDEGCALDITVRALGDGSGALGAVLPGAALVVESGEPWRGEALWRAEVATDADGRARVEVPCAFVVVEAAAPGFVPGSERGEVAAGPDTPVTVALAPGLHVHGVVTDVDGAPIEGAEVGPYGAPDRSGDDCAYELWVDFDATSVSARAFGHQEQERPLPQWLSERPERVRVDFTLERRHDVRVWCAGLPDDFCDDVMMQCTTPWSPVGTPCYSDPRDRETVCRCADGDVAVRGGGRAVLVAADEDEAWLDFRDTGRIVGRAVLHGEPAGWCTVRGTRIPEALEDLPRGLVATRLSRCEPDGRFALEGLVPGDWQVVIDAYRGLAEGPQAERTLIPRHVRRREEVDLGDVLLPRGGHIQGTVTDGLTGDPLDEEHVLAWRAGDAGERTTFAHAETAYEGGGFRMKGLPPGTWTVAHVLAPHDGVTVTVREGEVTRGVHLQTSDATALDENGFALAEEDGALVVQDVTPGSPADEAGLLPGEEVVGVLVGGFDLGTTLGEGGDTFARMVLGHWDGPGVTLVVETPEGEREEVPLEW